MPYQQRKALKGLNASQIVLVSRANYKKIQSAEYHNVIPDMNTSELLWSSIMSTSKWLNNHFN